MDEELIARFKKGEVAAFEELVLKYKNTVYNLIYRFTSYKEESEDLFQEVFLRLFRGLKNFRGESKFFTYLYRLCANVCFKAAKKRKSHLSLEEEKLKEKPSAGSPHEKYEQLELKQMVKQAISQLPPEQKMVVLLYRYHQISYQEIAEILKISVPAVKSRLHRAMLNLKEKLSPALKEESGKEKPEAENLPFKRGVQNAV